MPVRYDVTSLPDRESADSITEQINKIAEQIDKDTEMYLICEMAKMYMEGIQPHYDARPKGMWLDIYSSHIAYKCSNCGRLMPITDDFMYCPFCGSLNRRV